MIAAEQFQRFFGAGRGHYLVTLIHQKDAGKLEVYRRIVND